MNDGPPLPRGRRYAVRALLVLGTVLAVFAITAVFANRQVLNADNWADTSSALLEDDAIRAQLATFLVDEVYANVDVSGELANTLPPQLAPLAGPISGGLRTLAERTANRVLDRPRVQQAWENANRLTAEQFIAIAEDESEAITRSGDAVILDLRVILIDLMDRLGLPSALSDRIPEGAGALKIMSADQVETAEAGVTLLRSLAIVLPVLAFGFLGLAVFLAHGRRRKTLLHAGFGLIFAGFVVLVVRSLLGDEITSSLASAESVEPAVGQTWEIGTRMLRDVAQATVIAGIPLVLAALLAGPSATATSMRRAMAPYLRDRAGASYAVVGVLFALFIWWGPVPATRKVIPVLIMLGLLILGFEVLRRQTREEFPDAAAGDSAEALRSRVRGATARGGGRAAELERLAVLHERGVLTDEEFAAEKAGNGSSD